MRKQLKFKPVKEEKTTENKGKGEPCIYCGNPVRSRYATFILPDEEILYSHGKCALFPETYRKIEKQYNVKRIRPREKGPHGDIHYFKEIT